MKRTVPGKERLRAAGAMLAGVVVLAACTGNNLFTGPSTGGGIGPSVEITTPSGGFSIAVGDSILVEATVSAPAGGGNADYKGVYEGTETAAYTAETEDLNGLTVVTLSNYLKAAAGQTAGTAEIIVTVSDQAGEQGADTVTVTIS